MNDFVKQNARGILICLLIALPSWLLGKQFPVVGGPVIAILAGMVVAMLWTDHGKAAAGIKFTSKYILQTAVVLLGFGMDLNVVLRTGKQSLPIIICTIGTSLLIAWLLHKAMNIPGNISTLIGVGSSICGGSAIAATAPVIDADDNEVAQAISVIFFFNVLAAIIFPALGAYIGFDTTSGESFGIFAGTAVNDTSSVTAAASTWDSMWSLGTETLDKAVTVKLTRTLAIIPIALVLAIIRSRKDSQGSASGFSLKRSFPIFILFFIIASIVTTIAAGMGVPSAVFAPVKELSKFFIVMAMSAIDLLSAIPDYKNATELIAEYKEKLEKEEEEKRKEAEEKERKEREERRAKEEKERKDLMLYEKSVADFEKAETIADYQKSMSDFNLLQDYRDSKQYVRKAMDMIQALRDENLVKQFAEKAKEANTIADCEMLLSQIYPKRYELNVNDLIAELEEKKNHFSKLEKDNFLKQISLVIITVVQGIVRCASPHLILISIRI